MKITERSLQGIGQSLLITLPKEWTSALRLKKGSLVKIIATEQGQLLIAPEFTRQEQKKVAIMSFDDGLLRRFFREYLGGNEKITISATKSLTSQERRKITNLLGKFMNVQVIEETNNTVVVRVFRIEELTIEECMQRIHYLSLSMLDELCGDGSSDRIIEMEQTLTKFYYMLVMLIRMFLTEGRFVGQQISLVRAMDYRMVAEKMERIADITKNIGLLDNEMRKVAIAAREYYRKTFAVFMANDYEKATNVWMQERELIQKYKLLQQSYVRKKDIQRYQKIQDLFQILFYSRQISSFAR